MYAAPRKSFLPPIHVVVDRTIAFSPLKELTGNTFVTFTEKIWPFVNVKSGIRAYNFLNVGRPAVLIQTIKCSSTTHGNGPFGPIEGAGQLDVTLYSSQPGCNLNLTFMSLGHAISVSYQLVPLIKGLQELTLLLSHTEPKNVSLKKEFAINPQGYNGVLFHDVRGSQFAKLA